MRMATAESIESFGTLAELAAGGPVTITEDGRPSVVVVLADEYDRLQRRDRRVVVPGDLTEAELVLIEGTEMASEHAYLDAELGDWRP